jgi:chromosome segregation ATPase
MNHSKATTSGASRATTSATTSASGSATTSATTRATTSATTSATTCATTGASSSASYLAEIEQLKKKVNSLEKEVKFLKKEVNSLENEVNSLETQLETKDRKEEDLTETNNLLNQSIDKLLETISKLNEEIQINEHKYLNYAKEIEKTIADLRDKCNENEQLNIKLLYQLHKITDLHKNISDINFELETDLKKEQDKNEELNKTCKIHNKIIIGLTNKLKQKKDELLLITQIKHNYFCLLIKSLHELKNQ